jgi:hypothetical protein
MNQTKQTFIENLRITDKNEQIMDENQQIFDENPQQTLDENYSTMVENQQIMNKNRQINYENKLKIISKVIRAIEYHRQSDYQFLTFDSCENLANSILSFMQGYLHEYNYTILINGRKKKCHGYFYDTTNFYQINEHTIDLHKEAYRIFIFSKLNQRIPVMSEIRETHHNRISYV